MSQLSTQKFLIKRIESLVRERHEAREELKKLQEEMRRIFKIQGAFIMLFSAARTIRVCVSYLLTAPR